MAFMPEAKSSAASAPSSSAIGFFGYGVRGVAVAGVEHVGGRGAHLLIVIRDFESGSLVDRRGDRPIFLVQIGAAANRFGFRMMLVLFHTCSFSCGAFQG